jgi:hypothetical protein
MADVPLMPPTLCNRFVVFADKQTCTVILGFADQKDGPVTYFSRAALTTSDARWLCDVIEKQIGEAETK